MTESLFDRREFLKGAAVVGAGTIGAGALAACSSNPASSNSTQKDDTAAQPSTPDTGYTLSTPDETMEADVVICGSGMAGMTSALQAAYDGAKVILVEKQLALGGGTAYAEGIFACGSPLQAERGINADVRTILDTELDFQHYIVDATLWDVIANNSAQDISWLMDQGVEFIDVFNTGGGEYTHHIYKDYRGINAITALEAKATELGVTILKGTAAQHLLTNDDTVVGVEAKQDNKIIHINSKAVILATGSSGANMELMDKFSVRTPDKVMYTGAAGVEGDGIRMVVRLEWATALG